MGDDLIFAQKFTRTAADGLALLVEMENPRSAPEASVVIDMMTTVQRGAKRLRARHIYSGAQGVLSALHHEDDDTLGGRIESLGSLVTQYARGLNELLPAQNVLTVRTSTEKWEDARNTVNSLLPIASASDADMLSRLMRAPVTLDTVHPNISYDAVSADIMSLESLNVPQSEAQGISDEAEQIDVTPGLATPSAYQTTSTSLAASLDVKPDVALDAMMRDVIADALSVARNVGRTISLSYDMGDRVITAERSEDLRGRLGQTLSQIIRQSMSDDRIGHIDVNLAGEQLHIMAGKTAIRVPIDPRTTPVPKKLITPETEQGLRSQLNALMDPISLHETAS